jgi:hypothetical protein
VVLTPCSNPRDGGWGRWICGDRLSCGGGSRLTRGEGGCGGGARATEGGAGRGGRCFEQTREKGTFSPGMSVQQGLAAFCSSLCAYRWSSYSSSRARKMKMR